MEQVYLDNNATTRVADEVVEAMLPFLRDAYGNPSSIHHLGQYAAHHIELAREQVAGFIGARTSEIVFTSGGTESNNLAVRGALAMAPDKKHLVTTAVEHESVLRVAEQLGRQGYRVSFVGVDAAGRLNLDELAEAIGPETGLVSVMYANNETGVIFPIEQVGQITRQRGVPLHVDAVQAAGKVPIDVETLPVDLMSLSAHKFHGPKGVGALYIRRGVHIRPQVFGGKQERGLRAGTENVAGIVGMGAAAELAKRCLAEEVPRIRRLRDRLEQGLCERIKIARVNGDREQRLANTSNVAFASLESQAILVLLSENGICASSGSACESGALEPSHVLRAMGLDERLAHGAVRFSLSRYTTDEQIDYVLERVPALIERLQSITGVLTGGD